MDNYRKKIDEIDQQLMTLINERYMITKTIGEYKRQHNIAVTNQKREEEVLTKVDNYLYSAEIKDIYKMMFAKNKFYQGFECGLIGKSLPYTLSPMIYDMMGLKSYQVIETDDFNKTINKINYKWLNITIPYKSQAYHYCHSLDESAKITKSVNMIYHQMGYNTDYLALVDMFKQLNITNEKVTIIGNGATARAVQMALNKDVCYLVRTKRNVNELLLNQYEEVSDTEYLINATPYGTYPNIEDKPLFCLDKFSNLKMVIDVIYNPLNSPLIIEAKKHNIKTMNGLDLLVRQASLNYNIVTTNLYDKTDEVLHNLKSKLYNIVLIGLSYSGKTTIGKKLADKLNKTFIDTDIELGKVNHNLESLIDHPISLFRKCELELAKKIGLQFNQVIATGGGMVLSPETMRYLSYNSIIIHLDIPLETLKNRFDNSRPLLKNVEDLEKMYYERKGLYQKYRMFSFDEKATIDKIVESIYAYLSN